MKTKNIFKTTLFVAMISIAFLFNQGCKDEQNSMTMFSLEFNHMIDDEELVLGQEYHDHHDSTISYSFSGVNYYVSNIRLLGHSDEVLAGFDKYFLISEDETVDLGMIDFDGEQSRHYHMLVFDVGIDSVTNHSDPTTNGIPNDPIPNTANMHWDWDPGYRFIRIDGMVNGTQDMQFHVGKDPLLREVSLLIHQDVEAGSHNTLAVTLNLANVFHNDSTGHMGRIDLATEIPVTHSGDVSEGSLAYRVAQNFMYSFTFGEGGHHHGKK